MAYMVNNPEITEDYDLSCLRCIILGSGIPVTPAFKRMALSKFPDTVVGLWQYLPPILSGLWSN